MADVTAVYGPIYLLIDLSSCGHSSYYVFTIKLSTGVETYETYNGNTYEMYPIVKVKSSHDFKI